MQVIFALTISFVAACGVYLILSRHLVRIMLGVSMLSAAVNLVIFFSGRIVSNLPAVMDVVETTLPAEAANSLPQALILTAIVIGFSLVAFFAALSLRAFQVFGTGDLRRIHDAERLGAPWKKER
jgi:multicomponent Na+:H+ antiporter subunit C